MMLAQDIIAIAAVCALTLLIIIGLRIMAIIAGFQPVIDALNAAAAQITANAGQLPAGAASAQDVSDTLSGVTAAQEAVTNAVTPPAA
jgi:hypothetical protein